VADPPAAAGADRQIDERSTGWPVRRPASHAWAARRAGRCLTPPHADRAQLPNDWRIGIGITYIATRAPHIAPTRLSAILARGTDRFNHFDHKAAPRPNSMMPRLPCMPTHSSAIGKRRRMLRRCAIDCEARKRVPVQRLKAAGRRCSAARWLDGSSREPANSFSRKVPGR